MIISAEDTKDRRLSSETTDTDSSRSSSSVPVNQVKIYSSMRQQSSDVHMVDETDEETPVSPTPSSNSKIERSDTDSPISMKQAMKAAYAIMDGVSVSEVDLFSKDDEVSEMGYNDETSTQSPSKIPKTVGSMHSRSVGSVSAMSSVACDKLSISSSAGSQSRRSYPSNVRILRTPDGRRVNRRKPKGDLSPASERHSFPSATALPEVPLTIPGTPRASLHSIDSMLEETQEQVPLTIPGSPRASLHSINSMPEETQEQMNLTIPGSPRASMHSINSTPEKTPELDDDEQSIHSAASRRSSANGSQRSYPSSVRILRTPDGRRTKRRSSSGTSTTRQTFAGMVTAPSAPDLTSPTPGAATSQRMHAPKEVTKPVLVDDEGFEKGVQFSSVKIRYYERVVDINPACSSGVAIGLGWNYNKSRGLSVDEYELQKGGVRYHARQLLLPRRVREQLALEFGFTQRDIAKGTRANLKIRNERKQTIDNLAMMPVEEKIEGAKRKMKKVLSFRKTRSA